MVEIEIPLVPEASEQYLNEKQRADYETYRRRFLEWLKVFGKDPESVEGYAQDTVKRTAYRVGKWERFIWKRRKPTRSRSRTLMQTTTCGLLPW